MSTPEQQPNTPNLQSLESELSLSKAEMEEFRKLPKEEQKKQKDEKLAKLNNLNDKLDQLIQEAIQTGQIEEAIKLKKRLEKEIKDLEEKFSIGETLSVDIAREIMEKNEKGRFFGPEEVEVAFGQKIENIPAIPFTEKELEIARENNQFLVLRLDKLPDGTPLTMENMNTLLQGKLKAGKDYKILYNTDWYKDEDFYKKDIPKLSWTLVSKETVTTTKSKNYFEQTELLLTYAKSIAEDNTPFKKALDEAEIEFNQSKQQIASLVDSDWKKSADLLSQLKITKLLRHNPTEVIYDALIRLQNNTNDIMTKDEYIWTNGRSSDGDFVDVGDAGSGGVAVPRYGPGDRYDDLGASFSRSV